MSVVKKIIKSIAETGLEVIKDSAKQIAGTVGPGAMVDAALNRPKPTNDVGDYLKNLGDPALSDPKAYQEKQEEVAKNDEEKMKQLRTYLNATPAHMRLPQKPEEPRAYEKTMEEEKKKAMEAEAQKKQQSSQMVMPAGKKKGKLGQAMHQKAATGMETKQNIKSG